MKLSIKGVAIACGLIWGLAVFLVVIGSMIKEDYGAEFLAVIHSVYPGFEATASIGQAVIGGLYGLVDGLVGGALFAWVYNRFARKAA